MGVVGVWWFGALLCCVLIGLCGDYPFGVCVLGCFDLGGFCCLSWVWVGSICMSFSVA